MGIGGSTGILTNILIATLILVSVNFSGNYWFRFLNSRVLDYIGRLSYSLYLWQQIFFSEKLGALEKVPLNLLMILLVAFFSYNIIERPFLKLKNKASLQRKMTGLLA
jgi:peptidoglycan/LPS O-acetylase OafA/YrhL